MYRQVLPSHYLESPLVIRFCTIHAVVRVCACFVGRGRGGEPIDLNILALSFVSFVLMLSIYCFFPYVDALYLWRLLLLSSSLVLIPYVYSERR